MQCPKGTGSVYLSITPCGTKGLGLHSPCISMFCIFCMFCISMFSWILVRFLDHSRNAFCLCSWLSAQLFNCLGTLLLKTAKVGLPRWSSGSDAQAFNARGAGSVPGWGNKIPHAAWCSQKKKKKPSLSSVTPCSSPRIP